MKEYEVDHRHVSRLAITCESGDGVRVRLTQQQHVLRLRLMEGRQSPRSNIAYELRFGTNAFKGRTDQDGFLEVQLAPQSAEGELVFDDLVMPIVVTELLEVATVWGVQARLNNLGYEAGKVDGVCGRLTRAAIRAFQRDNPELEVDGVAGPKTQAALKRAYGC